jgi:hypothetical protein
MTDDDLWRFLRLTFCPISAYEDARRRNPYDRNLEHLSKDPAEADGIGGREWVEWAKSAIAGAEVSADGSTVIRPLEYLCRLLYVLQCYHSDPSGRPAVEKESLSCAFYGGLTYSTSPPIQYDFSLFGAVFERGRGICFGVEESSIEGPDWATPVSYVYLTDLGTKIVEELGERVLSESQVPPPGSADKENQGDKQGDKRRTKYRRKDAALNDAARACLRAFTRELASSVCPPTLRQFCRDWMEENGDNYRKANGKRRSWTSIHRDLKGRTQARS